MGSVRESLGLIRDAVNPRNERATRNAAARRAKLLALRGRSASRLMFVPQRRSSSLAPAGWRTVKRTPRHAHVIIWLDRGMPAPAERGDVDVVDLVTSSSPWARFTPDGWSPTQILLAAANSGLLNGYETATVVLDAAKGEAAHALEACADPHVGGVTRALVSSSSAHRRWVRSVLRDRQWETSGIAERRPESLNLTCRAFLLQGLRGLGMSPELVPDEFHFLTLLATLAQAGDAPIVESCEVRAAPQKRLHPRLVAFYLPQFHITPENDEWWGPGFTEWTNVASAIPNYPGHFQPKLPEDLGFYDLRLDGTRSAQSRLAKEAGVEAFMYYHYWFSGRRVLDLPLDQHIKSDELEQPFSIMWANENWTRSWDGDTRSVLLEQDYATVPAERFIEDALPYLLHDDYLTIGGKKLVSVYRPDSIPNFVSVLERWRETVRDHGLELFVVGVEYGALEGPTRDCLDGTMSFPPHSKEYVGARGVSAKVSRRFNGQLLSYWGMVRNDVERLPGKAADHFPGVMTAWDNTPRRQEAAHLWVGANPYLFRRWLLASAEAVAHRDDDERVVFINAWNEWAEGAMLEPSNEFGHSYLQATRDVASS